MMNKKSLLTAVVLALMFLTSITGAQGRARTVEFSIAGSMQAYVYECESEYGCGDVSEHYLSLPVRIGGFITPNILIEAETILTGWDESWYGDTEFGYVLSLNGSYNFIANEHMMPFVLFGIGFSNGLPLANAIAFPDLDGPRPMVLNAGAGLKALVSPKAALRIEYRLQDFSGEKEVDTWYGTYIDKINVTVHSMFFGVSLFL